MKRGKITEAVGQVDDRLIREYDTYGKRRVRPAWQIAVATAACFCLVAAGGLIAAVQTGLIDFGASSGGSGSNPDTPGYMFYTGPVFPLTLFEENTSLTARRSLTFDFSPYAERTYPDDFAEADYDNGPSYTIYDRKSIVSDQYRLENTSRQDAAVTIVYPFASSLGDLAENKPLLAINGEALDTDLFFGSYSGGFRGTLPDDSDQNLADDYLVNLRPASSWLDYRALLSDGQYMSRALTEKARLNQSVIVYEFSDFVITDGEGTNPSLGVHYRAGNQTTVLSYGFHSFSGDGQDQYIQGFSLPHEGRNLQDSPFMLIVVGEDIEEIKLQGYKNLDMSDGNEMGISATVSRREADLDETLLALLTDFRRQFAEQGNASDDEALERHYLASVELLLSHGVLADGTIGRYECGWLEDIFGEAGNMSRIIYLTADIVIPAGETWQVSALMSKKGSHDFYSSSKRDSHVDGYEMVTKLGSNLVFSEQTAAVEDHGLVEIVRQNFGFDLDQGIRLVSLELSQEHYFMEVRKIAGQK